MLTLADHILDITENSIRAGARLIQISIDEDSLNDSLAIEIKDDGHGMDGRSFKKPWTLFTQPKRSAAWVWACRCLRMPPTGPAERFRWNLKKIRELR